MCPSGMGEPGGLCITIPACKNEHGHIAFIGLYSYFVVWFSVMKL